MKIKIWMIRHGMTAGNRQQRYVGTTDELLCEEGRQQIILKRQLIKSYQNIQNVYVSPMLRCRETAEILFPAVSQITEAGFRECSFGEFEYRNYQELNGHPDYQAWIDSGGTIGFPGGEDQKAFCDRVQTAFEACIRDDVMPKARNWGQTYAGQNAAQPWLSMAGPSWPFFLNGQCRIRIIFIGRSKTAADIWFVWIQMNGWRKKAVCL